MKKLVMLLVSVSLVATSVMGADWWENIKVKGDLRYRHEMIDTDDADARHRHRLRARLAVEGKVNEETMVGVQLATGSDDPVSTNQTLDDAFSTKNIGLDLAYMKYSPARVAGLSVTGGKFKNPFFKPGSSELIWDSDWNPEGGAANFTYDFDNITVTLIASGLWIDERSSGGDSWIGAGQGMARFHFNEKKSSVALGGGFFNYVNAQGYELFAGESPGNSVVDSPAVYANDYEIVELFAEFSHTIAYIPVVVMGDFVTNTAVDSLETGWLVGIHIGKTKKPGSWALRYIYREVKKDAVVGTFSDSDFRNGGTDAKGHEIGGSYQFARNAAFNLTYFINEIGLEEVSTSDFNRMQADIQLKF